MLRRTRGFGLLELGLVLAIVVALGGIVYAVKRAVENYAAAEYKRGKEEVMSLWKSEALEAAREDTQAARTRHEIATAAAKDLQAANARAAGAEAELRRKHDEEQKNNVPATVVEGCAPIAAGDPRPVVRFTWSFVRDYDAAWTGRTGEPLFLDRPGAEGETAAAGEPSPYGAGELAGVHERNAAKCSKAIRQLSGLLDALDRLEAAEAARLKAAVESQ